MIIDFRILYEISCELANLKYNSQEKSIECSNINTHTQKKSSFYILLRDWFSEKSLKKESMRGNEIFSPVYYYVWMNWNFNLMRWNDVPRMFCSKIVIFSQFRVYLKQKISKKNLINLLLLIFHNPLHWKSFVLGGLDKNLGNGLDENYLSLLLAHIFTRRNFNEQNRKPPFSIVAHRGRDEGDTCYYKQSQITIISLHITRVYVTVSL